MAQWAKGLAIASGIGFIGYCIYFDRKRLQDPKYKEKVMARRAEYKKKQAESSKIPELKDEQARQKYFMEQVTKGEELITVGNYEEGVEYLSRAVQVCGQPQLLQAFQQSLPQEVFQMLVQKLMEGGTAGGGPPPGPPPTMRDSESLD